MKLRLSRLRVSLVTRRALIDGLLASSQPLVLVCAPAGSGKSVTLMQWVEADPSRLLKYAPSQAHREPSAG